MGDGNEDQRKKTESSSFPIADRFGDTPGRHDTSRLTEDSTSPVLSLNIGVDEQALSLSEIRRLEDDDHSGTFTIHSPLLVEYSDTLAGDANVN